MPPHLILAHAYWKNILSQGDTVIDATCGNGHDTFYLAQLGVRVIGYDIQEVAISATQKRVPEALLHHRSHTIFEESEAALIVYNLGYLPGGNKELTTTCESTLQSVSHALQIASKAISITCYPGHSEGAREESLLVEWASTLDSKKWSICYHRWLNRERAPSLLWLERQPS